MSFLDLQNETNHRDRDTESTVNPINGVGVIDKDFDSLDNLSDLLFVEILCFYVFLIESFKINIYICILLTHIYIFSYI